jgi:hypothetical protein
MNLLGLFMRAALQERLPALERARPTGDVAVQSGAMSVTLSWSRDEVVVRKGVVGNPAARLSGELGALAEVASGRILDPLLRRRVKLSGNPLALLPLARVFREGR